MALGTLAGGWRIVRTMGMGITKLKPVGGFCAETAGAVTLVGTAVAGTPVSTTPTATVNGRPRRATRGHPYGASAAT